MRQTDEEVSWVVYTMNLHGKQGRTGPVNAVCGQSEWEAMKLADSGNTLVRDHITDEAEAERLARGTSGDAKVRLVR